MAKDFDFYMAYDTTECFDVCTFMSTAQKESVMIGSYYCWKECPHGPRAPHRAILITCPKIMYRHHSGKVVMRKK